MKFKHIFTMAAMALPIAATAQNIDFDTNSGKNISVYDTWEESPFRKGDLPGNVAVVENPTNKVIDPITGKVSNESKFVLGLQRSRYGSNTFGARIDLKETFELTPKSQYVHVWVYKPVKGRVMVVGLGKRQDRPGQSAETEQFWGLSSITVEANQWTEVVIAVKGNGGIDIHSLVVVPDAESPHDLKEDFVAYIDNVVVNNDPKPSLLVGYYPINFDYEQKYTRPDNGRHMDVVKLTSPSDGTSSFDTPTKGKTGDAIKKCPVYVNAKGTSLWARAGEKVTPSVQITGGWMNSYVYLDKNKDGLFNMDANNSELVSYSFLSTSDDGERGQNSAGEAISGSRRNTVKLPPFDIPNDLTPGYYRLRYKLDWNNSDPAGNLSGDNNLLSNGGSFVDIRLNIHGENVTLTSSSRNGEVLAADGERLINKVVPFGKDFKIKMRPENGFEYSGIIVKHGYNLDKDSLIKDNQQWETIFISRENFDESDHSYTIPGRLLDGDVQVEGVFVQEGRYTPPARYKTTKVENGVFAAGTTWYTIQIGQQGYVVAANDAQTIALNSTEVDRENPAHLWCFVGSNRKGYQLYNMKEGSTKVLASPTKMEGKAGGSTFPTMRPVDKIPEGYVATWNFLDSSDLGTGVEYAYMHMLGYVSNKVNNRDNKFSFWTGGQDSGSTLRILEAKTTDGPITSIESVHNQKRTSNTYDLTGRRVSKAAHGIYLRGGKKIVIP
ncbi:MAG: hypothetical protein Q4D66_02810 [Bacteroidales bacterium]|nr:hypothetical protein [Bacteroidales bacterium]